MKISVYNGAKGTTPETREHAYSFAKQFFKNHEVSHINAKEIRKGQLLTQEVDFLFIPGGSTTYMIHDLKMKGMRCIAKFVKNGGSYIGICAGSYLASKMVHFESKDLKIHKKRPLGFYPGTQKGPYTGIYAPHNNSGFKCMDVAFDDIEIPVYLNGGGYFVTPEKYNNVDVLGRYKSGEACAVKCRYGQGVAYLIAPHLEYQPMLIQADPYIQQQDIERLKLANTRRFNLWRKILNL